MPYVPKRENSTHFTFHITSSLLWIEPLLRFIFSIIPIPLDSISVSCRKFQENSLLVDGRVGKRTSVLHGVSVDLNRLSVPFDFLIRSKRAALVFMGREIFFLQHGLYSLLQVWQLTTPVNLSGCSVTRQKFFSKVIYHLGVILMQKL